MKYYKITFAELKLMPPTFPFFVEAVDAQELEAIVRDYLSQSGATDLSLEAQEINRLEYEDET